MDGGSVFARLILLDSAESLAAARLGKGPIP